MGQTRSNHARFIGGTNTVDPLFNAQFLAYAKHVRTATRLQFRQKGDVRGLKKAAGTIGEGGAADLPDADEPNDTNPMSWYRYAQMYGGRLPERIQSVNAARALQLADIRKDTIGSHVREWAKAIFNQILFNCAIPPDFEHITIIYTRLKNHLMKKRE